MAQKIISRLQEEIRIYGVTAKYYETGFSIYYNDFTDQDKILGAKTEKEMDKGTLSNDPVFADEVQDEDDNNLFQD